MTDVDEKIRDMIRNENDLRNTRIGWLSTLQGLLFTAFGLAMTKPEYIAAKSIIALLGFAIACLTIWGVSKSIKARQELLRWWDEGDSSSKSYKNRPTNYKGPDVIGLRPSAQPYWTPGMLIPGAFAVAWPILYLATMS